MQYEHLHAVFGIEAAVRNQVDSVVPAEEELPVIIRQRDALRGGFEMNVGGLSAGVHLADNGVDSPAHGIVASHRLHIDRAHVEKVTSGALQCQRRMVF